MQPRVYTSAMQGKGEFDGGKITEQKPIGFPGEGSVVKRVGPLFYWAWARSDSEAGIGLHPHQGFEIMTYVVAGQSHHGDTLGTDSVVGAGGVQVMQTGSGVSHQEKLGAGTELFQIWFEPELTQAVRRSPTYRQYEHEEFPKEQQAEGVQVKTLIGADAPIKLVADAAMWDVEIAPGARYLQVIPEGYSLAALAIRGHGTLGEHGPKVEPAAFGHKDFVLAAADAQTEVEIRNPYEAPLRLILIQVPTVVGYPLYPKR